MAHELFDSHFARRDRAAKTSAIIRTNAKSIIRAEFHAISVEVQSKTKKAQKPTAHTAQELRFGNQVAERGAQLQAKHARLCNCAGQGPTSAALTHPARQ